MTDEVPEHSGIAKDLRNHRDGVLIAIGGGSASGKSTLASKIEEKAEDAVVLSLDDYYVDEPEVSRDHPESIDWGELKTDVLRLLNGRVTTVPTFDFEADERGSQRSVKPANLVVVEGLWACDMPEKVGITPDENAFVYVSDEIRFARRVLRDCEERGCEVHEVVERWQSDVRPHHDEHVAPTVVEADHTVAGRSDRAMEAFSDFVVSRHGDES